MALNRTATLIGVSLSLIGCSHPDRVVTTPRQGSHENEAAVAAITAESKRFSAAYVREDILGLVEFYTDDGVAAPGGRDFVRGRAALLEFWALPPGRDIVSHRATPVELKVDGNHAYDWGHYEGTATQDGKHLDFRGAYVIVWRRDEGGTWRIAVDMWHGLPKKPDAQ